MSGVAPGLGRPHLPEERGGDSGHLRLLGLVPLLLPAGGQAAQIQDQPRVPEHEADQARRRRHSVRQLFRRSHRGYPLPLLGHGEADPGLQPRRGPRDQPRDGAAAHSLQVSHQLTLIRLTIVQDSSLPPHAPRNAPVEDHQRS